jgi:hypothetical protein
MAPRRLTDRPTVPRVRGAHVATICSVLCASHSPFLYAPPREWDAARSSRATPDVFAPGLPRDSPEENEAKYARCSRRLSGVCSGCRRAGSIVALGASASGRGEASLDYS